jgi:hypothetical protein
MAAQPWTGIQLTTSFFPLSFFLYACTPTIVIDGVACRRPWGTHSFQLPPGVHNVRVFFRYLFLETCGDNSINVMVEPNRVNRIVFEMPAWMFSKGAMREVPPYTFG